MQTGVQIVIADVESIMQLFPANLDSIRFEAGREYDYSGLPQKLVQMGYTREYSVDSKGNASPAFFSSCTRWECSL